MIFFPVQNGCAFRTFSRPSRSETDREEGSDEMKQNPLGRVLVVDDEQGLVNLLCDFLSSEGYESSGFSAPAKSLEALKEKEFDILLTDLMMPEINGIQLLVASREIDPDLVGIIMTGEGSIQTSVEAMKVGAFDYLLKPFRMDSLLPVISRAMQVRKLRKENIELRSTMAVYELTKVIHATMDADIIANKVADAAMELCGADEVSIMLPAAEGDKLYVAAIRGEGREKLLGKQVGIGEGIAGWVARHRETLVLDGEIDDSRFKPIAPRPEIKTAVSHPMVAGGNFVGVVNINALRRRSFTPGQIKALNMMIGIAAPAIENSALFRRMQEMEGVLIHAAQEWRATFDSIHEMVWLTDPDGTILRCNKATQEYLNKPFAEILNRPCFLMMHGDTAPIKDCPLASVRVTKTRETKNHQIGENWYTITVNPILDESGKLTGAVHVISDITQNKRAEEELRAMSLQDELTGLLNRRGFMTLAEQQLRLVQRMKKRLILLFIDLDRMKWINDTLGHPEGDLALKNTGIILKKTFRESDLISRVGGDEFVVVTLNSFDESMETILARLEKNLSAFNEANQAPYPLSLSIGAVSSEEEEPCSIEALLTKADRRMYENKKVKNLKSI
jgi:diguanylate cyclase (GGDEF)-like protein/PAS domain S-box-containing protein